MEEAGTLKKSIEGGKWVFINSVSQKIIGFLSFLILARLLAPTDFGMLAILLIVPNFIILISATGFEAALIQKKEDPIPYLNPIWTFNVLKSSVMFLVIFFAAPLIASFFRIQEALLAVRLSGLIVLISGTANIAQLFFFKNIDFKKVFIRDTAGSIAYNLVTLTLAIFYRSFWPLFWGTVALHLFSASSIYFLHEFRPRFDFKFKKLLVLTHYSKWIYGQNLINRISLTIENTLIARLLGAVEVGLFTRAKSLASMPTAPFYNIVDRVAFPAYVLIQDSYEKIRDGFIKSLDILFFISIPIAFLLIEYGYRIIFILLGPKWTEMDVLLKFIAVAFAFGAFTSSAMPVFNAIGKPQIKYWIMFVNLTVLSASLFLLIPIYGVLGAAIGTLLASVITSFISTLVLARVIAVKLTDMAKTFLVPSAVSVAVLAIGRLIFRYSGVLTDVEFVAVISLLGILYFASIAGAGKFFGLGPYVTLKLIVSETLNLKTKTQ